MSKINWVMNEGNYSAALSYLSLIFGPVYTKELVDQLKEAEIIKFKAKDILRASGLTGLPYSNYHIKRDLEKIKNEEHISPILLVRDTPHRKVIIVDGYHRLCAIHQLDEDINIHCKIV